MTDPHALEPCPHCRDLWAALMFVKHPELLRLQIGDELVSREEWIDAVSQRIDGAPPLAPDVWTEEDIAAADRETDRLMKHFDPPAAPRWLPIASAPKDRYIILWTPDSPDWAGNMDIGKWCESDGGGDGCFWSAGGPNGGLELDHSNWTLWTEIPKQPEPPTDD